METSWETRFAQRTNRINSSAIREILKYTQIPDLISFAGGLPSPDVFPIKEFKAASERILDNKGSEALQYSITEGYTPLREFIVEMTAEQGVKIDIDNVLLTNGSQQGLDLFGKILINRGDNILVEGPTYLGALQAWNSYGAEYIQIETDGDGIIPEALEKAMQFDPKFVYLLPNFQNPTGKTIPLERRKQLVEICNRFDTPIIEDDPYGKLRYEGEDIPSVMQLDCEMRQQTRQAYDGNVIYTSTFSKILAPGLRLAWVIAPKEVIQKLIFAKQATDLHTSTLVQMMAYEVIQDNFLDVQLNVIKKAYGKRKKLMLDTLAELFPEEASWTKPEGGLFLWVTLPENINTKDLLSKAVEQKVAFVPGSPFFPKGGGENTMRLNFSNASEEEIVEGMTRLSLVIKTELAKK